MSEENRQKTIEKTIKNHQKPSKSIKIHQNPPEHTTKQTRLT